jgi:hypothetical protein
MPATILNSGLVPARFLCITAHVVIVITILIHRVNEIFSLGNLKTMRLLLISIFF